MKKRTAAIRERYGNTKVICISFYKDFAVSFEYVFLGLLHSFSV